ncbi:MAG: hypothetical protein ABIM45_06785 [candidate division WOR-3 bacterium]
MKEIGADVRRDLIELANTISKTSYPNSNKLKIFFYNLLTLQEIRDHLLQLKESYTELTGLNLDDFEPMEMERIMKPLSNEYFSYLEQKGISVDFSNEKLLLSLVYKKNPRGIEARYTRLLNLVTHLFNTPTTYVAISLNIDKNKLKAKIGDEFERLSDSLIEKYSWRDKLLKAIKYYRDNTKLTNLDEALLKIFEGFLKLTNTIELLGKNLIPIEKKRQIIRNLSEPMVNLSAGIMQYKDLKERANVEIIEMITDLVNILFNVLASFGKFLSKEGEKTVIYGIIEALTPLYVLGIETSNTTEGRQVELLRNKLAKLLKERHNLIDRETVGESGQFLYEGENFWNSLLIERVLCNKTQEIFQMLGIPIKFPKTEIDYESFFKPNQDEEIY